MLVENRQPNSRWYSGSGIYHNVWLVKTGDVFVDHRGTYITTPVVSNDSARVTIGTKIRNSLGTAVNTVIKTLIYDPVGNQVEILNEEI